MGRKRKEYIATNIKTNEQIRGYAIDFEKICNLSHRDFEKHITHGLVCRGTWIFEVAGNDSKIKNDSVTHNQNYNINPDRITFNDWRDWDRITSPFKSAIRREKIKEKRRENFRKRTLRTPYNT